MPEGPEVRRYADALDMALRGKPLVTFTARTKAAKAWLREHPAEFCGRHIERVYSHGKNLVGCVEGGFYFYSHLMMWGRWQVSEGDEEPEADRRERARITVSGATAILLSAPVFEVGEGEPVEAIEYLRRLGPDILPYPDAGPFDTTAFLHRLLQPEQSARSIGACLLDQTILAGVGNYLRAEILFLCRLNPWTLAGDLQTDALSCLCETIATLAQQAYAAGGVTVPDEHRERMKTDASLVYALGREYGNRHYVYRRTNLPCLVCATPIQQKRQVTFADEEGEKERIIYFCPHCQGVPVESKKRRRA